MRQTWRRIRTRVGLLEILMLLMGMVFLMPCVLAVINSFKTYQEVQRSPLALPESPTVDNYVQLFRSDKLDLDMARPMLNSLIMTVLVIGCIIVVGSMAAYWIMRRRSPAARFLRALFLAGLTIPFQIIMVPLIKIFRVLDIHSGSKTEIDIMLPVQYLFNVDWSLAFHVSYLALLIHYVSWGLPLCIFIYAGFMATIPKSLEEAAAIDGCGEIGTFWRVVFPLLKPCTITIIIFWGLWIWNDFMQAFIIVGPEGKLVFVQFNHLFANKYVKEWNYIFAGTVALSLPVTLLYLIMQRRFIKGLTAGSVKS